MFPDSSVFEIIQSVIRSDCFRSESDRTNTDKSKYFTITLVTRRKKIKPTTKSKCQARFCNKSEATKAIIVQLTGLISNTVIHNFHFAKSFFTIFQKFYEWFLIPSILSYAYIFSIQKGFFLYNVLPGFPHYLLRIHRNLRSTVLFAPGFSNIRGFFSPFNGHAAEIKNIFIKKI